MPTCQISASCCHLGVIQYRSKVTVSYQSRLVSRETRVASLDTRVSSRENHWSGNFGILPSFSREEKQLTEFLSFSRTCLVMLLFTLYTIFKTARANGGWSRRQVSLHCKSLCDSKQFCLHSVQRFRIAHSVRDDLFLLSLRRFRFSELADISMQLKLSRTHTIPT